MRLDEESRDWIYYGLWKVMYVDIRWRETEHEFIERAKTNAIFIFHTEKYYRRTRIVLWMDFWGAQQMAYEI